MRSTYAGRSYDIQTDETHKSSDMLLGERALPEEVTELILLCLPFPVLRETAPFVCKAWAQCVQVGTKEL